MALISGNRGSGIKSVQEVDISLGSSSVSGSATITAVDVNKSVVHFTGPPTPLNAVTDFRSIALRAGFSNSTTVVLEREAHGSCGIDATVTVIEFY